MKNENHSSYEQGKMNSSFYILHSSFKKVHYRNPIMHPKKSLSSKKVPRTKIRNTIARR